MSHAPAELFYLAEGGGRTRRGAVPVSAAEPGASGVTADFELNLEERLARFLSQRGRAYGSCHERVALALLRSNSGLLRASSLLAGFSGLALPALGFPLLSTLEHKIPLALPRAQDTAGMARGSGSST